jgi:hypothetical protein
VIGARGVAGGRPDAAVLLGDELGGGESVLALAEAPLLADALVQTLGEGLGEAVGDRLGHDRVVVVVLRAEGVAQLLQSRTPCVTANAPMWSTRPLPFGAMKSERIGSGSPFSSSRAAGAGSETSRARVKARGVDVELDVVAHGVGREEPVDAACRRSFFATISSSRRLASAKILRASRRTSRARRIADRRP